MLNRAKDAATIIQGLAAVVFLYTVFFPRATDTARAVSSPMIASWTPMMWSALALGVSVMVGVVLNFVALRQKPPQRGLNIVSARWYCTVKGTQKNVTRTIQGKVSGDTLRVQAHDSVLGDICETHGGAGHPKSLEVDFVYSSHMTAGHSDWLTVLSPADQVRALHEAELSISRITKEKEETQEARDRLAGQYEDLSKYCADNLIELGAVKAAPEKESSRRGKLSKEQRLQIEKAGVLINCANEADRMNNFLEKVWHLYNDDKQQTEGALIYPLNVSSIPDEIKEWRHKELWRFRTLYRAHIEAIKETDSDFHTNTVDLGLPCDGVTYLEVRRNLSNHDGLLRDRAGKLLSSFVTVTEGT